MKTLIKYLKDQGGQFWSNVFTGIGQSLLPAYRQQVEFQNEQDLVPLKKRMLEAQVSGLEQKQQQAAAEQAAVPALYDLLTKGITTTQPTTIGGPVQGPVTEQGIPPAPPPPTETITRPANPNEVAAAAIRAGHANQVLPGLIRQATGGGLTGNAALQAVIGFDPKDFEGMQAYEQRMLEMGYGAPNWTMSQYGRMKPELRNPMNTVADFAKLARQTHLMKHPGDFLGAEQAARDVEARFGVTRAAANVEGAEAQKNQPAGAGLVQGPATAPGAGYFPAIPPTPGQPPQTPPPSRAPTTVPSLTQPDAVTPAPPGPVKDTGPTSGQTGRGPAQGSALNPPEGMSSYQQRVWRDAAVKRLNAPLNEGTAQKLSDVTTLLQQTIPSVLDNFDPKFLGNVKGFEGYNLPFIGRVGNVFDLRTRYGDLFGSEPQASGAKIEGGKITPGQGKSEIKFQQALKDMKDLLLRQRSGAQINEAEFARLADMLPNAQMGEAQFADSMQRFIDNLTVSLRSGTLWATATRGTAQEMSREIQQPYRQPATPSGTVGAPAYNVPKGWKVIGE